MEPTEGRSQDREPKEADCRKKPAGCCLYVRKRNCLRRVYSLKGKKKKSKQLPNEGRKEGQGTEEETNPLGWFPLPSCGFGITSTFDTKMFLKIKSE